MKKIVLLVMTGILSICISGCSDFGFNPTGHWQFVSDTLYADGKVLDATLAENNSFLSKMLMVFEKSGTGYINADGIKTDYFRYEYDNDTVTVIYLPNEYHNDEISITFTPSKDGTTLIRTESTFKDNITYTEEYIYKKV